MADVTAARRPRASHGPSVDIEAIRRSVQSRLAGRPVGTSARAIQNHADAIGRGERSASPAKAKVDRKD